MEIYLNGEWGTITHNCGDKFNAHVVCRQFGYDTRCKYTYTKFVIGYIAGKLYLDFQVGI